MGFAAPHYAGELKSTDVSKIKGNASDDAKNYVYGIFQRLVGHEPWFNHEIGRRIELREVNIWGDVELEQAKAETIFQIELTPGAPPSGWPLLILCVDKRCTDMCNIFGIMHGGCAAYLIDQ